MAEAEAPKCSIPRRPSFCQGDVQKYRKAFDTFDLEKKGLICVENIKEAANRLGYRMSESQFQDILVNNEMDSTTKISFEEFLDIIPRNKSDISEDQHRLAELREKFQRYDQDANGVISLKEAQWALQMELQVSGQTALRLLNQFVKLDYERFVEFYGQVQQKKLEMYDMFGKYDRDLDGMISAEEAHIILHKELGFNEERSRAMVNRFDLNKDGKVSYMEFAEFYLAVEERKDRIRAAFKKFDELGEGAVSISHAKEILQEYLGFSESKAQCTVEIYDKHGDGRIHYEEFLEFFSMLEEERQRLLNEFELYDKDGDGRISFEEFHTMLSSQGYSEKDIQSLMAGSDEDHDGYLSFEEFRHYLNCS